MKIKYIIAIILLLIFKNSAAILNIDITKGTEGALPIVIVPFASIDGIISNDLRLTGKIKPVNSINLPIVNINDSEINFSPWQSLGIPYFVVGKISVDNSRIEFKLFDTLSQQEVITYGYPINKLDKNSLRKTAHSISNMVYNAITGENSAFNSHIAYVELVRFKKKSTYYLKIADMDGYNSRTILTSKEPLLSPAWSPDGKNIAYVSLEGKHTAVYIQNIKNGKRRQIAAWKGLNSAPSWSPDGSNLALSLSKDGNSEIYILNLGSRKLKRITKNRAIDTEPSWSPNGNNLVFTSDRGGKPQIYQISIAGGQAKRLTFKGIYNASASYSFDGNNIVYLSRNSGNYNIATLNLINKQVTILSNTAFDESPSFSPNANMVMYASNGELIIISANGNEKQHVVIEKRGQIREPVWSLFND
jgi:TolB protein